MEETRAKANHFINNTGDVNFSLFCKHNHFLPKRIHSEIRTGHFVSLLVSSIRKGNYRLFKLKIILDIFLAFLASNELGLSVQRHQIFCKIIALSKMTAKEMMLSLFCGYFLNVSNSSVNICHFRNMFW